MQAKNQEEKALCRLHGQTLLYMRIMITPVGKQELSPCLRTLVTHTLAGTGILVFLCSQETARRFASKVKNRPAEGRH
jgi:hypothetical protein